MYGHLPVELQKAIYQDLVEINLGLDYGDSNDFTLQECESLMTMWHKTYKKSDSAKSKAINSVKAMTESAAKNLLKSWTE